MENNIIELISQGGHVHWGIAIPQYFFFTGISAAAFLLSSLTYVFNDKRYEAIAGLSLIVAFTVLLVAPLNLIADLAQPGRFYSLFFNLHATSPMSWGVFLLTFYPLLILAEMCFVFRAGFARHAVGATGFMRFVYLLLALKKEEVTAETEAHDHRIGRILGIIGIPTALAVHGYTGYILGVVKARSLWHTPLMPLIFLVSAMVSGIALMILLNAIMIRNEKGRISWPLMERLGLLLAWSIVGDLLLRLFWYSIGLFYSAATFQDVATLLFEHHFFETVVLELGLCLGLPLLVMAMPSLRRIKPLFLFSAVLAVAGVMLFRWDTVIGGQLLPKTGAGYYHYLPPFWGRDGVMHVIGNWGLWVFLFLTFTFCCPWQKNNQDQSGVETDEKTTDSGLVQSKGVLS
jgi:tetrathionate reductase subunit C